MNSAELEALDDIKRLLMALLLKFGASSQEIAAALGVDSSAIRKMFSMKAIKKAAVIR
jgi:NADH/NAD ratio-sensing transcriptional regulator Rex